MDRSDVILRKAAFRLIPLMMLMYVASFLDRVNIGFAALQMNEDLGFSAQVYGLGAGIFFWGYFLFEVPSNLMLEKVGARIWMCRIMVTWGLLSMATAFVTGPVSFFIVRFLLGAAHRAVPGGGAAVECDRCAAVGLVAGYRRPLPRLAEHAFD